MERCWQRYGGKLVGPGEKTGRKYIIKLTFVCFRFLAVRSLACLLLLSLLRVVLWLWSLIEDNHQLAKRRGEAGLLTDNHKLLEAEDYNHSLKSYKPAGEQANSRRINLCWTVRPGWAEQSTNRILEEFSLVVNSVISWTCLSWYWEIQLKIQRSGNSIWVSIWYCCLIRFVIVCWCTCVVLHLNFVVEPSSRSAPKLEWVRSRFILDQK